MLWVTQLTAVRLRRKLNFDYSKAFHRISVIFLNTYTFVIVFGFLIIPMSYKGSWVCEFDQQQNAELLSNPFIHSSHKDV